ncbi:hypothetical protein C8T65DRAFT_695745 [Cerioporus squamosus]|nr:hypothetical protein C8T65DRAFT_695745 [Cerioporus squamosus]
MSTENGRLRGLLAAVHREVRLLKKQLARVPKMVERKLMKERARPITLRLRDKGIYTAQARMLARTLVRFGTLGVSVEGKMSARTVRRALLELGAASDIQTAYEILQAKCFTISGDATTNRNVNKEAQHALIMLSSDDGKSFIPKNHLLGVHATTDHTSETQFNGWQKKFHEVTTAFNNSPLSPRIGQTVDLEIFALKLRGVGGDHAADQLKTMRKMQDWKKEMTYLSLARNHLTSGPEPSHALQNLTSEVTASVIAAAGGLTAWEELSAEDRVGRLGCAMHKDLNAVKGGASVMGPAWIEMGATPPILLANKENASTLRDINPDLLEVGLTSAAVDELTPAELRALESSTRGGVKLTSLAGALFNHQDDKRGYHDTYVFYFQQIIGHPLRFPDTSNTRYQSHCAAAAELLTHLPHYIRFLELVRDKKTKPGFTKLEENVYRGLHDPATLTELAVLALYGQAVTHPYMRVPLLVRFLKGALETWERFTIEFAAGGVIDGLSAAERGSVCIMPTNDHNEGILGGDRVWTRQNPNGSEAVFNAEKKAERNETEKFMEEYLNTEEDERNLRSTARKKEAQHHESER